MVDIQSLTDQNRQGKNETRKKEETTAAKYNGLPYWAATKLHPFNGLFPRTTWVSRHQNGKPFWKLLAQVMMGVAVASAGPYANHLHLAPDR